jgi:hypothetical protein
MVLTAVAFKFTVSENIPKISYNTRLDTYVLFCFIFLAIVAVENAVFGFFELDRKSDLIAFLIIGGTHYIFF